MVKAATLVVNKHLICFREASATLVSVASRIRFSLMTDKPQACYKLANYQPTLSFISSLRPLAVWGVVWRPTENSTFNESVESSFFKQWADWIFFVTDADTQGCFKRGNLDKSTGRRGTKWFSVGSLLINHLQITWLVYRKNNFILSARSIFPEKKLNSFGKCCFQFSKSFGDCSFFSIYLKKLSILN